MIEENTLNRTIITVAFFALISLAGCDRTEKIGAIMSDEPMTLIFTPGYEIAVDSKAVQIHGGDICPKQDRAMNVWFGASSNAGLANCLVIGPTTKTVMVQLALASPVVEEWAVIRDEKHLGRVSLRRPNGLFVVSFAEFAKLPAKT